VVECGLFAVKSLFEIYEKDPEDALFTQFIEFAVATALASPHLTSNLLVARQAMSLFYEGAQMNVFSDLQNGELVHKVLEFALWIINEQAGGS
jgi:hypothetical protein